MKQVKKKYKGKVMSNGKIGKFNTDNITATDIPYFELNGFEFIFEEKKVKE